MPYQIEFANPSLPENIMRLISFITFAGLCFGACAAQPDASVQPAAPALAADETIDEPQVTISTQTELTVQEYRAGGRLYMIKITPKIGAPYYLVDDRGDGKFARHESLDSGLRVPRWIIKKF